MTVKELINRLKKQNPDREVFLCAWGGEAPKKICDVQEYSMPPKKDGELRWPAVVVEWE